MATADKTKERLGRGEKAPYIDLEEAFEILQACYDRAGDEVSFDLFSEITRNSLSSSSFQRKIKACRDFGLITLTGGNRLELTEITQRVFRPRSLNEKQEGLKEAFLSIDIFRRVYDRYLGKILPQDEYLANVFVDYVPQEEAPKWNLCFLDSAFYAGLLFERPDGKTQVIDGVQTVIDNAVSVVSEALRENAFQSSQSSVPMSSMISAAPQHIHAQQSHLQMLIDILDAKDMTDVEQDAVWALIRYLKRKEAGVGLTPKPTQTIDGGAGQGLP